MEVVLFVFFRLKMVLSVKCLGFQGEVTSYSVLVQGYCKRQFGKFFLVPWPFSLLLSLFVSNPTREREGGAPVSSLCPRSLSSLVLWVVETMNENLYSGGVAGWSAFLLSHGYLGSISTALSPLLDGKK